MKNKQCKTLRCATIKGCNTCIYKLSTDSKKVCFYCGNIKVDPPKQTIYKFNNKIEI